LFWSLGFRVVTYLPLWHVPHFKVELFWTWTLFAHFCNTCHPCFLFKAFYFHFASSCVNSYKYILTYFYMYAWQIYQKNDSSLGFKPIFFFLPPKIRNWNLKKKVIPSRGYFVNTLDWIILVQAIERVLLKPIIS